MNKFKKIVLAAAAVSAFGLQAEGSSFIKDHSVKLGAGTVGAACAAAAYWLNSENVKTRAAGHSVDVVKLYAFYITLGLAGFSGLVIGADFGVDTLNKNLKEAMDQNGDKEVSVEIVKEALKLAGYNDNDDFVKNATKMKLSDLAEQVRAKTADILAELVKDVKSTMTKEQFLEKNKATALKKAEEAKATALKKAEEAKATALKKAKTDGDKDGANAAFSVAETDANATFDAEKTIIDALTVEKITDAEFTKAQAADTAALQAEQSAKLVDALVKQVGLNNLVRSFSWANKLDKTLANAVKKSAAKPAAAAATATPPAAAAK